MSGALTVVLIGASAGGPSALRQLLGALSPDIDAALFVCQHVAPDRPSRLVELLASCTSLPVQHARDADRIETGRIYVAPPDNHLLVDAERMRVIRGPQENRFRPAIDAMFRSAARAHGPRAIGVVLTGHLGDGTVGLQAIKACGGVTVVQDPADAEHPSMAENARRHVEIDYCVALRSLAPLLSRLAREAPARGERPPVPAEVDIECDIAEQRFDTAQFLENVERIGSRTTYACPLCNGSIWQIGEGDPLRFRCHVGHSFTAERFWAEQSQNLENALWSAVRLMEEKVTFARQFAARMRENRLPELAVRYERHAERIDKELTVIRNVIVGGRATTRNVQEDGG
jgi:two-component system, chemotaxis family, protein-glutamate methylesterase/glutaminase